MDMNVLSLTPRKDLSVVSLIPWVHDRAEKFVDQEAYEKAIKYFNRLLVFEKEDTVKLAEVNAFLGDIYLGLNDFGRAYRYFKKSIELDSLHPHYHYLMGFNFAQVKRWALARNCFERAHKLDKENAEYLRGLGWALVMLGERGEGEELLKKALKKDPNSLWALVDLGYSYYRRGAYKDAMPLFEEAILRDSSLFELREVLDNCRQHLAGRKVARIPLSEPVRQSCDEVRKMIRRKMAASPYQPHLAVIKNGLKLWDDFIYLSAPKFLIGSPGWAGAVEFLLVQLEYTKKPEISCFAQRYGAPAAEIVRKARVICQALKVSLDDARYASRLQFLGS